LIRFESGVAIGRRFERVPGDQQLSRHGHSSELISAIPHRRPCGLPQYDSSSCMLRYRHEQAQLSRRVNERKWLSKVLRGQFRNREMRPLTFSKGHWVPRGHALTPVEVSEQARPPTRAASIGMFGLRISPRTSPLMGRKLVQSDASPAAARR
jgi:hypothetical protein